MISQIPQNHCRIIERFGKPVKVQNSGLAFKLPIIDKVRNVALASEWGGETNKNGVFIELSEQILDTDPRECITKDNAKVQVDTVINWRIVDPIKAVYEVDKLHYSLVQATLNAVRSHIGQMELDDALTARNELNEKVASTLAQTSQKWGINIIRAEIQELRTDDATSSAMLQQLEAERKSRALSSEATGTATATIKKAEAEKQAAILRAEGIAQALQIVTDAEKTYLKSLSESIGYEEASKILLSQKVLDAYKIISENPAHKIYLPSSIQSIFTGDH
tara:strand:- start:224 stop:1057 length:834 start_codon:yes stop_codon:yes gene_type:complete